MITNIGHYRSGLECYFAVREKKLFTDSEMEVIDKFIKWMDETYRPDFVVNDIIYQSYADYNENYQHTRHRIIVKIIKIDKKKKLYKTSIILDEGKHRKVGSHMDVSFYDDIYWKPLGGIK